MFQRTISTLVFAAATFVSAVAFAQTAPDALIKGVSDEVIASVKSDKQIQAGDLSRIQALVDTQVMPHVDFQRMTAATVGKYWKQATPEQQEKLQGQFKTLLIRTNAGAHPNVNTNTTVTQKQEPSAPEDTHVTERTEIRGKGDPVQIDYRLEKAGADWKIFDVNVLGVWLVDQYKGSFAQVIAANGIDGLISQLEAKNKAATASAAKS